jgi:hypothetical protein
MLNSSAIANDSKVKRNVVAKIRAGTPTQRGPPGLGVAMLLNYTIIGGGRDS